MKEFWTYMWKQYPLVTGALAKFINVDKYPEIFYMGDSLVHVPTNLPLDEEMVVFMLIQFYAEYFDTIIYTVPQQMHETEDLVMAMGVYFPQPMSECARNGADNAQGFKKSKVGESPRLNFFLTIAGIADAYTHLILSDPDTIPLTKQLSNYLLQVVPEEESEELIN